MQTYICPRGVTYTLDEIERPTRTIWRGSDGSTISAGYNWPPEYLQRQSRTDGWPVRRDVDNQNKRYFVSADQPDGCHIIYAAQGHKSQQDADKSFSDYMKKH